MTIHLKKRMPLQLFSLTVDWVQKATIFFLFQPFAIVSVYHVMALSFAHSKIKLKSATTDHWNPNTELQEWRVHALLLCRLYIDYLTNGEEHDVSQKSHPHHITEDFVQELELGNKNGVNGAHGPLWFWLQAPSPSFLAMPPVSNTYHSNLPANSLYAFLWSRLLPLHTGEALASSVLKLQRPLVTEAEDDDRCPSVCLPGGSSSSAAQPSPQVCFKLCRKGDMTPLPHNAPLWWHVAHTMHLFGDTLPSQCISFMTRCPHNAYLSWHTMHFFHDTDTQPQNCSALTFDFPSFHSTAGTNTTSELLSVSNSFQVCLPLLVSSTQHVHVIQSLSDTDGHLYIHSRNMLSWKTEQNPCVL